MSVDEVKQAIRSAVLSGNFFGVMGGDGRGVIVEKLLDMVVDYLPAPTDRPTTWGTHPKTGEEIERKHVDSEPFAALAFKIATDPFVGKLAYFRAYSGKVVAGSYVLNSSTGEKERVGRLVRMQADKREDVAEITAGDIAAIVGLKGTTTGNTLCDPTHPIVLESITFPDPPVSIAIEPKTKSRPGEDEFSTATPSQKKTRRSAYGLMMRPDKRLSPVWVSYTSKFSLTA